MKEVSSHKKYSCLPEFFLDIVDEIERRTPANYKQPPICDDLLAMFVDYLEPIDLRKMEGMSRAWRHFSKRKRNKCKAKAEEIYFSEVSIFFLEVITNTTIFLESSPYLSPQREQDSNIYFY